MRNNLETAKLSGKCEIIWKLRNIQLETVHLRTAEVTGHIAGKGIY